MLPINCKYSFVTVSDTIYSVLICTYWNFIINTLHTCFKLINIFEFMSLELFVYYSPSIFNQVNVRRMRWTCFNFTPLYCTTLKSQLIHTWHRFPFIGQTCFQNISNIWQDLWNSFKFFLSPCCLWIKTNENFSLREIIPYALILWFPYFLCSSWN